jgi:phospholipid/cholesterol/gamma-HCH transport system ATP-binding protein
VIAQGTPRELLESGDARVHQFLHMEPDGPVRFHYPAEPLQKALHL